MTSDTPHLQQAVQLVGEEEIFGDDTTQRNQPRPAQGSGSTRWKGVAGSIFKRC
jgi:hypothetical protein